MNDGSNETTTLYVWLAKDAAGVEGIVAYPMGPGATPMPLLATDFTLACEFETLAAQAAQARGHTARLVAFNRGDVQREVATQLP